LSIILLVLQAKQHAIMFAVQFGFSALLTGLFFLAMYVLAIAGAVVPMTRSWSAVL